MAAFVAATGSIEAPRYIYTNTLNVTCKVVVSSITQTIIINILFPVCSEYIRSPHRNIQALVFQESSTDAHIHCA